ncbi:MAG: VWA domain-containing protein [Akkermansiaceae bacterium]|nr:VWA domain-containing protein [Akkermansiaceae bacterium]
MKKQGAFTLVELSIVIGLVGIMAALAYAVFGNTRPSVEQSKLDSDIAILNQSINAYVGFGGNLADLTEPSEVLTRLKSEQLESEKTYSTGLTGQFIDPRLRALMMSEEEASSNAPRAVWDAASGQFVIASEGFPAVKHFYLGEPEVPTLESRPQFFSYGTDNDWVWDFQDRKPLEQLAPTSIVLNKAADPTPAASLARAARLYPPALSLLGGTYPGSQFPLALELRNVNPGGSSSIVYRLDGGPWLDYSTVISVPPGTALLAFCKTSDPTIWSDSLSASATYLSDPTKLLPPEILLSATKFDPATQVIKVSLSNPNPAGSSDLRFALKTPNGVFPSLADFESYSGEFSVSVTEFPDGFSVQAYADSANTATYLDSDPSEAKTTVDFFGIPVHGNVLFVIDASGSMEKDFGGISRFQAAIKAVIASINSLDANQTFSVTMFNGGTAWADGTWKMLSATKTNKDNVISAIQSVVTGPGTSYQTALSHPAQFATKPERVILLSDGQPTTGPYDTELQTLVKLGIEVNGVFIGAVGTSASDSLKGIASATGGAFIEVAP